MSATMRTLSFSIVVEDYEHWTKEHLAQCDKDDPGSYDDWVVDKIYRVMAKAGDEYIKGHPDLFRGSEVI